MSKETTSIYVDTEKLKSAVGKSEYDSASLLIDSLIDSYLNTIELRSNRQSNREDVRSSIEEKIEAHMEGYEYYLNRLDELSDEIDLLEEASTPQDSDNEPTSYEDQFV